MKPVLAFLVTLALPLTAWARPDFPGQIQSHLGMAAAPGCVLCHDSDAGGGPVSQPFGQAMLAAGLTSAGGKSLTTALDALETEKTDSNGDGVPDIDGMRQGILPTASKPPVEYGCGGARVASPRGALAWHAPMASVLVLVLLVAAKARRERQLSTAGARPRVKSQPRKGSDSICGV